MSDFGDELATESHRIPWLIWIQILVVCLLVFLLFCFSLLDSDLSDNMGSTNSSLSSASTLTSTQAKPILEHHHTSRNVTKRCQPHQAGLSDLMPYCLLQKGDMGSFCCHDTSSASRTLLWSIIAFVLLSLLSPTASLEKNLTIATNKTSHDVVAYHGVVATDDGRCSRIGLRVLREGGHAIDATIAAALCLGVVSPASSGIGGGGFMVVRLSTGEAMTFDMREKAPIKASKNMYNGNAALKSSGALSIAVPGELAGLHQAWKQYGRLPWERLVRPAEKLARRGFKVSTYLRMQMETKRSGIFADTGLRKIFTANGELLRKGDNCSNKALADTLRTISKYGVEAFYNGSIGTSLIKDIQKAGGILTMEDLRGYQVKMRQPISANFLGYKIIGMPPPSSGGASVMLILNILAQYGVHGLSGPLGIHRLIEALKHAFAVRMNLGDPDFVNVTQVLSDMLSPIFGEKLKKSIHDDRTFGPAHYGGKWNPVKDHGTSHLSVVDSQQNAVSMTTTVNFYFGSLISSPGTGIVLNNQMDDFSMPGNSTKNVSPPAPANFIMPGKRPLSSVAPSIVLKDEQVKAVIGASGGGMIIAGVTEVLLNHFAKAMDPLSSVLSPRLYHQLIPNVVDYENWTSLYGDHFEVAENVREFLHKRGHKLESHYGGTVCQFIIVEDLEASMGKTGSRELVGVSDPRKGGYPAGY